MLDFRRDAGRKRVIACGDFLVSISTRRIRDLVACRAAMRHLADFVLRHGLLL